jgi:Sulfotransferase family
VTQPPIFIVGCQRSGTTLVRLMLDSHPGISCGPETRFLEDLAKVTTDNWQRLAHFGFPKEYWLGAIAGFFDGIQRQYAQSRGKTRWADKTPRYALSLDFIDQLFPDCRVVHVVRDGRDVVVSHRSRFGYVPAVKAAEKWPRYIEAARAAGARLGPERYHELRYEELVADPESTMRRLLGFLDEPWNDAVLHHEDHPHDVADKYAGFAGSRRQQGKDGGAVYRSRVGAHRRELGVVLRLLVRVRAGAQLRELGYR